MSTSVRGPGSRGGGSGVGSGVGGIGIGIGSLPRATACFARSRPEPRGGGGVVGGSGGGGVIEFIFWFSLII